MFDTVVCSSVREAEDLLTKRDFALVFCEDRFKEGTYVGLLSVFGHHSKVPIVVMISDVDQDFVFREAMALGAFGDSTKAGRCSMTLARMPVPTLVGQAVR